MTNETLTATSGHPLNINFPNYYHGYIHGNRATLRVETFKCKTRNDHFTFATYSVCIKGDNFSRTKGRRITDSKTKTLLQVLNGNKRAKDFTGIFAFKRNTFPAKLQEFLDNFIHNSKKDPIIEAYEKALNIPEETFDYFSYRIKNASFNN